ncbi:unnamed protein product [Durusdinium trenchii]|uniref:Uncharacterized protein n=1 Tax=Durusdinium trenchii TaxID=1381693 RepID=A0ABP0QU20_9DINO
MRVQVTFFRCSDHFCSAAGEAVRMLWNLSLEELMAISERMAAHYAKLLVASVHFWRGVIISLVEEKDASMWKG